MMKPSHVDLGDPLLTDEHDPTTFDTSNKQAPNHAFPVYNELETVSKTDLTFSSILKGTAANPLTNFEKKAALVNAYVSIRENGPRLTSIVSLTSLVLANTSYVSGFSAASVTSSTSPGLRALV